jgi:hypothetical protein
MAGLGAPLSRRWRELRTRFLFLATILKKKKFKCFDPKLWQAASWKSPSQLNVHLESRIYLPTTPFSSCIFNLLVNLPSAADRGNKRIFLQSDWACYKRWIIGYPLRVDLGFSVQLNNTSEHFLC